MGNWENINEDSLEEFIKANKDKFSVYKPVKNHEDHFLIKLHNRFRVIINIIPYLFRVALGTILIFGLSIWAWDSWIRWDREYISLPQKIENTYHKVFHSGK